MCGIFFGPEKGENGLLLSFWDSIVEKATKTVNRFFSMIFFYLFLQIEAGRKFETFSGEFFRTSGRKMQ